MVAAVSPPCRSITVAELEVVDDRVVLLLPIFIVWPAPFEVARFTVLLAPVVPVLPRFKVLLTVSPEIDTPPVPVLIVKLLAPVELPIVITFLPVPAAESPIAIV